MLQDTSTLPKDVPSRVSVCYLSCAISSLLPKWRLHAPNSAIRVGKGTMKTTVDGDDYMYVGSQAEGLDVRSTYHHRTQQNNAEIDMRSDDDVMIVTPLPCKIGPREDDRTHIVLATSDTKPGYVRLEHIPHSASHIGHSAELCDHRKYFGIDVKNNDTGDVCTFMSVTKKKEEFAIRLKDTHRKGLGDRYESDQQVTLSGPAVTVSTVVADTWIKNYDYTIAIKCNQWPVVAEEWLTRNRQSAWLSTKTLTDISNDGCHLVQVAHCQSIYPEIEWRFSFTTGEKKLAHSLSDTQRQCYVVLKMVVGKTLHPNKVVSSYCLKNILFWAADKKPKHVWDNNRSGLGICFLALLNELTHCLVNHNIPQYFIRQNNLIGHKPRDAVKSALKQLVLLRQNPIDGIFAFDKTYMIYKPSNPVPPTLPNVLRDFVGGIYACNTISDFKHDLLALCRRKLELTSIEEWDNDFCEIVHEASLVEPNFFWKYIQEYARHIEEESNDEAEYEERVRRLIGKALSCFVHWMRKNTDEHRQAAITKLIAQLLEKGNDQFRKSLLGFKVFPKGNK